eukprot:PhF_6_TR38975/c0_g1_i1/m.58322
MCGRAACAVDPSRLIQQARLTREIARQRRMNFPNTRGGGHRGIVGGGSTHTTTTTAPMYQQQSNNNVCEDDPRWIHHNEFRNTTSIPPGSRVTVMYYDTAKDDVVLHTMSWGFVNPSQQQQQPGGGQSLIFNARADTLTDRVMFSNHLEKHRCVMLVSGYIEWQQNASKNVRMPFYFYPPNSSSSSNEEVGQHQPEPILCLAALWDGQGKCTVITVDAAKDVAWCHARMPVILNAADEVAAWMDPRVPFQDVKSFLHPAEGVLAFHALKPSYGSSKDNPTTALEHYKPKTLDKFFKKKDDATAAAVVPAQKEKRTREEMEELVVDDDDDAVPSSPMQCPICSSHVAASSYSSHLEGHNNTTSTAANND